MKLPLPPTMSSRILLFSAIIAFLWLGFSSCKKDKFTTNGALDFSNDTVIFDTVFTQIGSSTKAFKIYNTHNENIRISKIYIAGGETSKYRMNIDGVSGRVFTDIEIAPNDSMWGFVEVTLDPNNQNTPLIVTDSIIFETNGVQQDIDLVAFGQDAIFLYPEPGNFGFYLDCSELNWNSTKPYVIYGQAIVKPGCTLDMAPGTRVYIHKYSSLAIAEGAGLDIHGTKSDSVIIQGDRLELDYRELPGQWQGLFIKQPILANIDYAVIKNGNLGIFCDGDSTNSIPASATVHITNTKVLNMGATCFYGRHSKVKMENCVWGNGAQYVAAFTQGGDYECNNCTFADYYSYATRNTPAVLITNYFQDENDVVYSYDLTNILFNNCLIYGSNPSELEFSNQGGGQFNYKFRNTMFRVKDDFSSSDANYFESIYRNPNGDSLFVNSAINDYHLRQTSPARDKGNSGATPIDIDGKPRDSSPDLGAYEFIP